MSSDSSHRCEPHPPLDTNVPGDKSKGLKTDLFTLTVYVKGKHLSYQRGKRNTNPNTSLLKIEGVDDTNAAKYVCPSLISHESHKRGGTCFLI